MMSVEETNFEQPGWNRLEAAEEASDLVVDALARGGVKQLFFTSGSDILSLQESVSKAQARGTPSPEIITCTHEAVALNAAVGSAMVSGCPAATAVHVDVGLQNHGCALHNAHASNSPVLLLAGSAPRAYPGELPGARNHPIYWVQDKQDQREALANYTKWRFRLELQDNPGLVVTRALQAALSGPQGPSFLSLPREAMMASTLQKSYPTLESLGVATPAAPDPAAITRLTALLLSAERPLIIVGRSGKDIRSVEQLIRVAEAVGATVTDNGFFGDRLNFPSAHPLWDTGTTVSDADLVLVVDNKVPWVPAPLTPQHPVSEVTQDSRQVPVGDSRRAPNPEARVVWLMEDPIVSDIPLMELVGELRITSDPTLGLRTLADALENERTPQHEHRAIERIECARAVKGAQRQQDIAAAHATLETSGHMDPRWLAYQIGLAVDHEAIVLDESLSNARLTRNYFTGDRPGSWFGSQGSGGGWCSGAAIGAKLAAPERDVVFASGDGYYMFGSPQAALWTAMKYGAPYLGVIYLNERYSTGVDEVDDFYPDGYAARADYPGGRFGPVPDFAAEARTLGAFGEYVEDPHEVGPALRRGLAATREGSPAIVAVRVR